MKELAKLFKRRYSAVSCVEEQEKQSGEVLVVSTIGAGQSTNPEAFLSEKSQGKSFISTQHSMNTANILSSFFNERESDKRARSPKRAFLLLAIGVLAITTAIVIRIVQPYDSIFKWKLKMEDNGEIFNLWAKPPVDLYIKIYLFNITNAEAFLAGEEKMNVVQVGPYVYKELLTHENITFNENNTMSTIPSHPLVWQEHLSEGRKEDDEVVMLNIAMLAIAHLTGSKSYLLRMALNTLFITSKSEPIVRMTAKEFMFGYQTSLTTLGNTFLRDWIYFEKVGLIDRMYDFHSDYETFYTGAMNPSISGLYATYRGDTNLPQWNGDHCSNIEFASDGTKFKSFLQPNETVKFFRKSMCRPINLYPVGDRIKFGSLSGYKYVFEDNAFDNGVNNEENKCFCRNGKCQPQGLIDVADCYYGFPISLSYPHFLHGESSLEHNITGLAPSVDHHSSAFYIQPESGLPLSISAKVQINMHFDDMKFSKVQQFSHLTIPMLWFDIMMPELPDQLDTRFNLYLNILPYVDILGFWIPLLAGIGLLCYAITRAIISMSTMKQMDSLADGKYSRANLLQSTGGNVYNPCEVLLTVDDEKALHRQTQKMITRSPEDEEMLYTEINLKRHGHHMFALELEQPIDNEEDNESDTVTLSNKSTSSSCIDEQTDELSSRASTCIDEEKESTISIGSSGFLSSLASELGDDENISPNQSPRSHSHTNNWAKKLLAKKSTNTEKDRKSGRTFPV